MCDEFLALEYFPQLDTTDLMPAYPVFFTGTDCGGERWPPNYSTVEPFVVNGVSFNLAETAGPAFQGLDTFWVPPGVTLNITDGGVGAVFVGPELRSSVAMITDPDVLITNSNWYELTRQSCLGQPVTIVGRVLTVYDPSVQVGRATCDRILESFCSLASNLDLPECACFADQSEFRAQYPDLNVPVVCYGARCQAGGYRTDAMVNAECALAVCQEVSSTAGTNLVRNGTVTLECDNQVPPLPTPAPAPEAAGDEAVVDESAAVTEDGSPSVWTWVVLAFGVVFLFMSLGAYFWTR